MLSKDFSQETGEGEGSPPAPGPVRSALFGVVIVVGIAAILGLIGVLRPGQAKERLVARASVEVKSCMSEAGYGAVDDISVNRAQEEQGGPDQVALRACWADAAANPAYRRAGVLDPNRVLRDLRRDGFAAYRCLERRGHRLRGGVPMSGSDGYPLAPNYANFIPDGTIDSFYDDASDCYGWSKDMFMTSEGRYPDASPASVECTRHEHYGSGMHSHGCYMASLTTEQVVSTTGPARK